jgi:lipid-binding SYLF domain-containing protein
MMMLFCYQAIPAEEQKDKRQQKRDAIDQMAKNTLDRLFADSENAQKLYDEAVGYAVFDSVKVAVGVSGGGGMGVAVDKSSGERTYMNMGTAGIGLGIGGKSFQIVFIFESKKAFDNFIEEGWQAETTAGAAAGTSGKDVSSSFIHGVAIYQVTNKGLIAQADVSGTKFWKSRRLN